METTASKNILSLPLEELMRLADRIRRGHIGRKIELCGIVNAKSGLCSEDCRFCAQSAHYATSVPEHPLLDPEAILNAAKKAETDGAMRFGIVTSGQKVSPDEIDILAQAIRLIRNHLRITPCASLGALDTASLELLKDAGLARYHHNIETSPRFYRKIVSTHTHSERVECVKAAKKAGLEVCSGGIIGMGESWQDRIDMAIILKELDVDSVPLNFLVPIPGTPLEHTKPITPEDALRAIALFRIILKDKIIKVAAGRESVLADCQEMIYAAGANGMLIGGYLTIAGRSVEEDKDLVLKIMEQWNKE